MIKRPSGFTLLELLLVLLLASVVMLAGSQLFFQQIHFYNHAKTKLEWQEAVRLVHFHINSAVSRAGDVGCFRGRSPGFSPLLSRIQVHPKNALLTEPVLSELSSFLHHSHHLIASPIIVSQYFRPLAGVLTTRPLCLDKAVELNHFDAVRYSLSGCHYWVDVVLEPTVGPSICLNIKALNGNYTPSEHHAILNQGGRDSLEFGLVQTDYYYFNAAGGFVKCSAPEGCHELIQEVGQAEIEVLKVKGNFELRVQLEKEGAQGEKPDRKSIHSSHRAKEELRWRLV